MHSTTPNGIVGGFEFTVFQRNKSRFDSYSVRNCVLTILHITFWDCRVHIFSDNLSRNSCIQSNLDVANVKTNDILYSSYSRKNLDNEISLQRTNLASPLALRYIELPLFVQTSPHSLICILLQMAGERSEAIATIIEEAGGFQTIFTCLLEFTLTLGIPSHSRLPRTNLRKTSNLIW